MELNPNHPVIKGVHDHWHKVAALILYKLKLNEVVITLEDIKAMGEEMAVMIHEKKDGIHVRLLTLEEAERLAKENQ